MNEILTVNGMEYEVIKLLGKGKGGCSYLVTDGKNEFVLKKIHHEPCDYYTFGNKLESELRDYETLRNIGLPMPRMIAVDKEQEHILKEYIAGETVSELLHVGKYDPQWAEQVRKMCGRLYPAGLNIDYFPTNFVLCNGTLYYIDYECNKYMEEWNFEHWGDKYWFTASFVNYSEGDYDAVCDFLVELNRNDCSHINWNWARFEWMYEHLDYDKSLINSIGLWICGERVVGAAIYDMYFGEAFCGALREYGYLYPEILEYALKNLRDDAGIAAAINDENTAELEAAAKVGFTATTQHETIMKIELTRGDFAERMNAYAVAYQNNFYQLDEIREREDLPPLGFNFIKLGLDAVLVDPKTREIYTPNTGKLEKMNAEHLTDEQIRAIIKSRGNPNHDPKTGRFTSGGGATTTMLTKESTSDVLHLPDIEIGRSLSAKAKNYEVDDLRTGEKFYFAEGTHLQNVEVFAGKGTSTVYRNAYKYANRHGGEPEEWQHVKATGVIDYYGENRKAEVHWSQHDVYGKHDFFVKEWLE